MTHDDYLEMIAMLEKIYVALRYCVVVGFMGIGLLVSLCFLGGRRR